MAWILHQARERAQAFQVTKGGPLDMQKTLGVLKNIIPAIASTNALIAAQAALESFKIVTSAAPVLDNYILFNAEQGCFSTLQQFDKSAACEVCGNPPRTLALDPVQSLESVLELLLGQPQYGLQNPRLLVSDRVLYMRSKVAQLRDVYEAKLRQPVGELMRHGDSLTVDDDGLPSCSLTFTVKFASK